MRVLFSGGPYNNQMKVVPSDNITEPIKVAIIPEELSLDHLRNHPLEIWHLVYKYAFTDAKINFEVFEYCGIQEMM